MGLLGAVHLLLDGLIERLDHDGRNTIVEERADLLFVVIRLVGVGADQEVAAVFPGDVSGERLPDLPVDVIALFPALVLDEVGGEDGRQGHRGRHAVGDGRVGGVLAILVERLLGAVTAEDDLAGVVELGAHDEKVGLQLVKALGG